MTSEKINYTLQWLIEESEREERIKYLFFWGHQKSKDGSLTSSCFSQWWESPFEVDGMIYRTAEHWMMAQKALLFGDKEIFDKIRRSKSPGEAKELGRQVKNFEEDIWNKHRLDIVVNGNLHKFGQDSNLKAFLLSTKDRVLVEASPVDNIWGIGLSADNKDRENPRLWKGLNLLGFSLMTVRDILMNNVKFNSHQQ